MPRTVRHDQIIAGNALTSFGMQIGVLVGPAIGGLLVAYVGIGWCFVVDIVGLAVATLMYVAMRPYPHVAETTPPSLAAIGEGMRYALGRRDLLGTYVVDLIAMFFAMPVVLFPALADEVFGRPEILGLLYSAETVGAVLATALQRLDGAGLPPRAGDRGGRCGVRPDDRAGRADAERLAGAAVPDALRRRGHDLGGVPRHRVEPDHPRADARTAGRHRDAVLLPRPARRPDPGRGRRRPLDGARRDRQRRPGLRRAASR